MEWIASRILIDENSGMEVIVALARPRQVIDDEWSCAFSTDVAAPERTQQAHGVDALQALLHAIQGIHWELSRSGQRPNWIMEPGDTDIPRLTPTAFGLAFRQRIERMIDDVIARHAEEGRRRHERSGRAPIAPGQSESQLEAVPDDGAPDLLPSETYLARIGALDPSELEEIDCALLAVAADHFQKVVFLVAAAITKVSDQLLSIPDVFYAQRVRRLVKLGQLEAQGDLERMRSSEVRLPRS